MQRLLLPFAVGFLAALAATMSFSVLAAGRAAAVQFPPADSSSVQAAEAEDEMSRVSSGSADVVSSYTPVGRESSSEPAEASARGSSAAAASRAAPTRLTSDQGAGAALTIRRDSAGMVIERRLAWDRIAAGGRRPARAHVRSHEREGRGSRDGADVGCRHQHAARAPERAAGSRDSREHLPGTRGPTGRAYPAGQRRQLTILEPEQ